MGDVVRLSVEEQIARISIHRPEAYNALSRQVVNELDEILNEVHSRTDIKVVVIKSEKNFASGADICEMADCTEEEARAYSFSDTFEKLKDISVPTLAVIEGYALGGGLELALACDLRIAAGNAKLGLPEITLGIIPGAGGTVRLSKLVGEAKAKELIFLGTQLSGQRAVDIGLVNAVTEPEQLEELANMWAKCLALRPLKALKAAKKSIRYGIRESVERTAVEYEGDLWAGLFRTCDQREGMKAFLEKRTPEFKDE